MQHKSKKIKKQELCIKNTQWRVKKTPDPKDLREIKENLGRDQLSQNS